MGSLLKVKNAKAHCNRSKRLFPIIKMAGGRNAASTMGQMLFCYFRHLIQPDLNVMDLGLFNNLWTKIHKVFNGSEKIPSVDDVWEAAKVAWESITSVDIEILFKTLHLRMGLYEIVRPLCNCTIST